MAYLSYYRDTATTPDLILYRGRRIHEWILRDVCKPTCEGKYGNGIAYSSNSFVYAGFDGLHNGPVSVVFDTISILTLPAFNWIQVPYTPKATRIGHSCNAVGGSQIISIGGADVLIPRGASSIPSNQLAFNASTDPFTQGLGIFDMTILNWVDRYTADAPDYERYDLVKTFCSQNNK